MTVAGTQDPPGPISQPAGVILVAAGGAAGVLARGWLVGFGDLAIIVAVINIVGSFLLGLLSGAVRGSRVANWALPLAGVGFLGGFTTLSAVSGLLAFQPDPAIIGLTVGQVILGVLAAWGGLRLADWLRARPLKVNRS